MQGLLRAASRPRPIFARPPWSTPFGLGYRHQLIRTITKKFTKDHEMLVYDDDMGRGKVHLTDHAQSTLGDVVYVEFQTDIVGKTIEQGDCLGSVESVKAASDFYAPVSGTVIRVNDKLQDQPKLLNKSVSDKGWLCEIQLADIAEMDGLLTEKEYKAIL